MSWFKRDKKAADLVKLAAEATDDEKRKKEAAVKKLADAEKKRNEELKKKIEKIEKLRRLGWWKNAWITTKGGVLILFSIPFFIMASKAMFFGSPTPTINETLGRFLAWFASLNILWEACVYAGAGALIFSLGISVFLLKGRKLPILAQTLEELCSETRAILISIATKTQQLETAQREKIRAEADLILAQAEIRQLETNHRALLEKIEKLPKEMAAEFLSEVDHRITIANERRRQEQPAQLQYSPERRETRLITSEPPEAPEAKADDYPYQELQDESQENPVEGPETAPNPDHYVEVFVQPKKEKVVEPAKKEAKKDGWSWRKFQQWIDNPPK